MEALHDRKLQALISNIRRNANASYHAYPDFKPSTLPKLRVNFDDMMKIAPVNNFEEAYNIQQQMRNADANAQQYRGLYLESIDREIEAIKSQLDNPNIAKDTSDNLLIQLEEKLKSKIEPRDPNFIQKNNLIATQVATMKNQLERQEADTIMKDYKFMAGLGGNTAVAGAMMQLPSINQSYNKLLKLESKARNNRMDTFDMVGDVADVAPVRIPAGALPAAAPEAAPAEAPAEGGGGGGGGAAEEKGVEEKGKKLKPNAMAISRMPKAGIYRDEIEMVYNDALERFKGVLRHTGKMTQTDKLKEIQRLNREGYIYTTNSRGRKKQDE